MSRPASPVGQPARSFDAVSIGTVSICTVRGRPSPPELVAVVIALSSIEADSAAGPVPSARRTGRWNDPASGMRTGAWAHDLSPRRYGRATLGGN